MTGTEEGLVGSSDFVVMAGLKDDNVLAIDEIDQSMLVVDPPRPGAGQHVAQRLGLADASHRISALYVRPRLLDSLALGRPDGRYALTLGQLARVYLIVLDDFC